MSFDRFKLFNLLMLFTLVLSACGSLNASDIIPNVEIPDSSDVQDQPVDFDLDVPIEAEQPMFGDQINNAIAACPDVALNEICLGSGSSSGVDLGLPGGRVLLAGGEQINLTSSSLDDYSVVIARLQAPGVDTDYNSLLLLAVGTVDVSFDEIFYGRDETNLNLPRLTFSSTNGADFQSGVAIINESDEDLLGIEINGVGLTLGSTAVVTSQPNGEMKVTMQTGTVAVSASGETVSAVQGGSVKILMTQDSKPTSAPASGGVEEDLLTPLVPPSKSKGGVDDDLLTPLWPGPVVQKFKNAYDQCLAGDARQVYRIMYFARILLDNPDLNKAQEVRKVYSEGELHQVREKVKQCATFELILDSTLVGSSAISWQTKAHGEAFKLQFDEKGNLVNEVRGNIVAMEFEPNMPVPPGCTYSALSSDGELAVIEGSTLGIYYNTMRIRLNIWAENSVQNVALDCPSAPQVIIPLDWDTYFIYLHEDLFKDASYGHVLEDWEYTGGEIYAESYYLNRSGAIEDGDVYMDSAFVLRHVPQK